LPQVIDKCKTLWPNIGSKVEKTIPSNLGSQFATLRANVCAFIDILTTFINNLGPNNKPKMLKVGL
jgi:hypothetical protein